MDKGTSAALTAYLLIVVAAVHTQALSLEQLRQTSKIVRNMCLKKTSVDLALVEGIQEGKFPDDQNLKCYMKCCMGAMQVLRQGRYNVNAAKNQAEKMLPPDLKDRFLAMLDACSDKAVGEDDCEMAYQLTKCSYEADKEIFLFP
ncbi:general odorant-binding protein 72-like [Schistocerca serialis cubense]|uniref:general odorant-binding protein 72-like n=1 Tax=Schistocerca serialis cubense TaxID=2023355 RepID=UPI00214E9625|nr:general odorant-binding protein 72-like [Schistocerca serialis cubense]